MRNWDVIRDEGVGGGVVDSDDELADLEGCKGLFDGLRDADAEGGYGVVCVLKDELVCAQLKDFG